ncbi:glycohydrolase toxin TNT-related protein [Epilithonimonas hungarica]|uniref:TNT domain-containing protein n=1 Tax=Epilithonimonas hungarica TaxID=454006 RepID=A0A1G7RTL8_9FLAO|nr:glycohydrolase toxin TNT-related protein [Epilithonimonas hungarica]MDP9955728.1 hypothetical protein [Epilithonimonas hungarica]SDG13180.1 Protein of unknown function [Epilithonimonas hungarica]
MFKKFINNIFNKDKKETLRKGEILVSADNETFYKEIRSLSPDLSEKIVQSTIPLFVGQLYSHYLSDNVEQLDIHHPERENQTVFFWNAEETFEKKSLPPHFEKMPVKYFIIVGESQTIQMQSAQAMPWFGMPGLGTKFCFTENENRLEIQDLEKRNIIQYLNIEDITDDSFHNLNDREYYIFLVDERIVKYQDNNFYLNQKIIPIDLAYKIGGIHLAKKI